MSCKKKEQSSCTSTQRRVVKSLSIKDMAQARADCLANSLNWRKGSPSSRKSSVSPSLSGQYECDRDDCNLVYRTSHWNGSVSPTVSDQYVCDRDDCNQVVHRTSHRKGSVSPSVSGHHISVRDDCNLGIHRFSHHQWPGSSGTRPPSRKQSKTCSPLCTEVSAVIDDIKNCRDAIGALAQDAQRILGAASGLLDACVCDNKSDQTKRKHKKVDSCCRKILGKKGSNRDTCCVPSSLDNFVCDDAETKKRKSNKVTAKAREQSCQKICREKSSHKVTASDCACNEKKKKQNKKIVAVDSKTGCQKKNCHKDSSCLYIAPKDVDDCFCEDDMKKQRMKVKKTSSSRSFQKKTCAKNTCYLPPVVVDECACEKEMKKRNKKLKKTGSDCCQRISGEKNSEEDCFCEDDMQKQQMEVKKTSSLSRTYQKKTSDKNTCCYLPPIAVDDCACAADMKKRNKNVQKTDCQDCCKEMEKKGSDKDSCCIPPVIAEDCACDAEMSKTCQKMVRKKSSVKDTCCVLIAAEDLDDCVCEGDMKNQNNKIIRTESKPSCQKVFEKKSSDKNPLVFQDWTCETAGNKMQSDMASAAMSCGIPSCAENTCTCRFPPAYRQYFDCTGQISGSCQCDKNT